MRITNKIMQNNSLYNINNNKVAEDTLNTMMSTGKKITRPSEDPVIAIRALRLRSNVVQLDQYYEKNAKDAESWLDVTADALSTVTAVLTDCVKQANKGSNKDLTLDDLETIVTQIDALAKEYYATGNVDFAGRYVFTGYRTETPLTFDDQTSAYYKDIRDGFSAEAISDSNRVTGKHNLDDSTVDTVESDIVERTVGKIRLSYDNLAYIAPEIKEEQPEEEEEEDTSGEERFPKLMYREAFAQPAISTVTRTTNTISVTFKPTEGVAHYVELPTDGTEVVSGGVTYTASGDSESGYTITGVDEDGNSYDITTDGNGNCLTYSDNMYHPDTELVTRGISDIAYNNGNGVTTVSIPLLPAIDQTYELTIDTFKITVNSDGTYTVKNNSTTGNPDGTEGVEVINVTSNGSVRSSYYESSMNIENIIYSTTTEEEKDAAYEALESDDSDQAAAYFNAATGEVLLNDYLKRKLSKLPDIINAQSIAVEYDKKQFEKGDIKPEHLFSCTYKNKHGDEILYNKGTAPHDIAYDVGFAQSVVVNTTADAAFTTSVKRDAQDLSNMLSEIKQINTTLTTLKKEKEAAAEADKPTVQAKIDAAQKAYDFMRENIQKEFEHKITSMQKALDVANIAVTDNGTRSKRLDLIADRLMTQTTTFQTLKSENEDIDLAEAATKLTTAQVTYEASLMATGKISQTSLMNYI